MFNFAIIFNTAVTGKWTADFIFHTAVRCYQCRKFVFSTLLVVKFSTLLVFSTPLVLKFSTLQCLALRESEFKSSLLIKKKSSNFEDSFTLVKARTCILLLMSWTLYHWAMDVGSLWEGLDWVSRAKYKCLHHYLFGSTILLIVGRISLKSQP